MRPAGARIAPSPRPTEGPGRGAQAALSGPRRPLCSAASTSRPAGRNCKAKRTAPLKQHPLHSDDVFYVAKHNREANKERD